MDNEKHVIEINGIKMEVDLRTARRVDHFRVGDRVRVLTTKYSQPKVYPGVIIGFVPFQKLPSIEVLYVDTDASWHSANECLKTIAYNTESKDVEIASDNDQAMIVNKNRVLDMIDRAIREKEREAEDLRARRAYFIERFGKYIEQLESQAESDD